MQGPTKMRQQQIVRQWMDDVMRKTGWAPERWARQANIAPTTITRFLNSENYTYLPSYRTLTKLAGAANVSPPDTSGTPLEAVRRIPVYTASDLKSHRTRRSALPHMATTAPLSELAFAAVVGAESMTAHGIHKGDRVVLEPPEIYTPSDGDLIAARYGDTVYVYEVYAGSWIPHGSTEHRPIQADSNHLLGTVFEVSRPVRKLR